MKKVKIFGCASILALSFGFMQPKAVHAASCTNQGEVETSWFQTDEEDRMLLEPGQWLEPDKDSPRDKSLSFWKASEHNTQQEYACAYKTIRERHKFYDFADAYLNSEPGATRSRWFKAAYIVTGRDAVGAAEIINLGYLSDATDKFMIDGNKFLFSHNIKNFQILMNGKKLPQKRFDGLSGKDLDYELVEFEQEKLEEFMKGYSRADLTGFAEEINSAFTSTFAPSEIKDALEKGFESQEKSFDFLNKEDRVKLGQLMIDKLY